MHVENQFGDHSAAISSKIVTYILLKSISSFVFNQLLVVVNLDKQLCHEKRNFWN